MPGLSHTLDVARRAMSAQQATMSVIGHNVSNVGTEGYSRQVANLTAAAPSLWEEQAYGNGVEMAGVLRKRDRLLDRELRQDFANLGRWTTRSARFATLESVINEPSESSIGAAMDEFWGAWSELSSAPDDMTRRATVREQGQVLTYRFHTLTDRIGELSEDIDREIITRTDEFNLIISEVKELNAQIAEAELRGLAPNDLYDRRDVLLDQVSELASVTVGENDDGTVYLRLGGRTLVDQGIYHPLTAGIEHNADGTSSVIIRLIEGPDLDIENGILGGLIEMREETLPTFISSIDTLAATLIESVNARHRAGTSSVPFFQGRDAASIEVAPEIVTDLRNVNTSTSGLAGDNDVALAIAGLRDSRIVASGSQTPREYWESLVGRTGVASREARFQEESLTITRDALLQERSSISGVSLDEEMANILLVQQAYVAAVRIFEVVNDMMDVMLGLG